MSDLEPLNVDETVARLATLYQSAGPRLGCAFVEPNAVLTIAGARGDADLSIDYPIPDDLVTLERLQPTLLAQGLHWDVTPEYHETAQGRPFWLGMLSSLAGYARVSRFSHLPGVAPFDPATAWEGLRTWQNTTYLALQAAYPKRHDTVWLGVILGYPDQAILDFCQALEEKALKQLEEVSLPAISHYVGAQPIFAYRPEHANDPGIVTTGAAWQELLERVYASEWHQQLATDPAFQAARRVREGTPAQ